MGFTVRSSKNTLPGAFWLTRLLAEVFSHVHTLDAVAANWITLYEENKANAMCDLINFVLRCSGCPLQIDIHDIGDPDNAPSRLEDLQNEFHAQKVVDYPLVSRAKGHATFRATMTGFFHSLISTAHAAGLLYSDLVFIENIEVWVVAMSDSAIRPFRHTATVIALAIGATICGLTAEIADNNAKVTRQKESEQKKKTVNKERVKGLEVRIAEGEEKREAAQRQAEGLFDAVYTHRYRDVDAKIRLDCVTAFGSWIAACPEVFFSGHYIRYLGWVLSDTSPPVRAEVIKQLSRLYRNREDVGRLRAFTEKFRPRLVEMAIRDAEPNVRAATVELMNMVRETGLLEPDDVDNIGRLIFDTEPRVRKAVASFFAENINDLFESVIDDLGGEETIEEAIGEENEDDFETPRRSWLRYKCLAEQLQGYDGEQERYQDATQNMTATGEESRLALAAQAVCAGVKEVNRWEALVGYLLYDLSNVTQDSTDPESAFKARCQLNEREEPLLLEILYAAVKSRLADAVAAETDKKGRSTKQRKEESREIQESTALHLAKVFPRLLKKFGTNPSTASAVLRLGQILNLEIFQELRQDETEYAALLGDINKQFLTHADPGVLTEASTALLHARSFEDLGEVTDAKVQELWEDTINILRSFSSASRDDDNISNLCQTVRRIVYLASISDCVEHFESQPRSPTSKKSSQKDAPPTLLSLLLSLLEQLTDQSDLDTEQTSEANELLLATTRAILFYYLWIATSVRSKLACGTSIPSIPSFTPFTDALLPIMESRALADSVRLGAAGAYLNVYTLFATFRHVKTSSAQHVKEGIQAIPASISPLLISLIATAEKSYAKRARKTLEPETDDVPEDIDLDPFSDDEDEAEEDEETSQRKRTALLLAEKALCELAGRMVLAIIGGVLDSDPKSKDGGKVKERLLRNKLVLGPNFRAVLAHLDAPKAKRKPAARKPAPEVGKGKKKVAPRREQEEDMESIEDDDEENDGGRGQLEEGGEEDLRARELDDDDDAIESVEDGDEADGVREDGGRGGEEDEIMGD